MKISQVYWNHNYQKLYVKFSDITLTFYFKFIVKKGDKWLGWKKIKFVRSSEKLLWPIPKQQSVPIRNITDFIKMFLKNYSYERFPADNKSLSWIAKEKKKTTKD